VSRKRRGKTLKKIPTTREGRQPKAKPTPERLAQFKRLVGRDYQGAYDSADTSPISIMEARGLLNGDGAAKVSAAHSFRSLYIHRNGQIDAKSGSIGDMTGNGSIGFPREVTDLSDADREQDFKELNDKLYSAGRNVQEQIVNVGVCENVPMWLDNLIAGRKGESKDRDDLMIGLDILIY